MSDGRGRPSQWGPMHNATWRATTKGDSRHAGQKARDEAAYQAMKAAKRARQSLAKSAAASGSSPDMMLLAMLVGLSVAGRMLSRKER